MPGPCGTVRSPTSLVPLVGASYRVAHRLLVGMHEPHSSTRVADALRVVHLAPSARAALLVALPAGCVPQLEVDVSADTLGWRGVEVARTGDPVRDAVSLAASGWRDGDAGVDLDVPASWIRVRRSGASKVCFGADTVLAAGPVTASAGIPDDTIIAVLGELAATGADTGVFGGDGADALFVAVVDGGIRISDLEGVSLVPRLELVDAATVADEVAAELGAEVLEAIVTFERSAGYEADLLMTVDGVDVIVPVVVGVGGVSVGALRGEVAHTQTPPLIPAGFTWVGVDVWEGIAVGECDRSGICVKFPSIPAA